MYACVRLHVCASASRSQELALDPGLEFQVIVSCLWRVLGTKLQCSAGAVDSAGTVCTAEPYPSP